MPPGIQLYPGQPSTIDVTVRVDTFETSWQLSVVPSVEGISHNEKELTSDEDMLAGLDLLTELLGRVADGEFVRP